MTQSDDVGSLLGGMSLLSDGEPADPAYLSEWNEAVEKVQHGSVDADLHLS